MNSPQIESLSPVVILVEPQSPGNIGMVCRAMANFGASELRLVKPCVHLHPEARKFAVFAHPLLGKAELYKDLQSALADLQFTVAATRRTGKLRGELLDIRESSVAANELPSGTRIGIVFGREDAGLTSEEVSLCTCSSAIPTEAETGSLNLAQAVLLFLYEFYRARGFAQTQPQNEIAQQGEVEGLLTQMEKVLHRIAFLNPKSPEQGLYPLRRIFLRAMLSRHEVGLLRSLWTQIAWSVHDWKGRKRGDGPDPKTG